MVSVGTTCHIACHTLDMVIYIIEKCKRASNGSNPSGGFFMPRGGARCRESRSDPAE
nr:MAG TPA: hypothetical protein [Caudoviricetes sp.]